MKAHEIRAIACHSRAIRDLLVAGAAAAAVVACGGSIESGPLAAADPPGADASVVVSDGGERRLGDAGAADVATGCPADPFAAIGKPCSEEGRFCGGPCTDPCSFCNIVRCERGKWTRLEAPPAPCVDGSPRRWPDARMSWQAPGGYAGWGPALIVSGDTVRVWDQQSWFDPDKSPSAPADHAFTLSGQIVDNLFDTWANNTPKTGIPHGNDIAECYATLRVRTCASCANVDINYSNAKSVSPELSALWRWFAAYMPSSVPAAHPVDYCRF